LPSAFAAENIYRTVLLNIRSTCVKPDFYQTQRKQRTKRKVHSFQRKRRTAGDARNVPNERERCNGHNARMEAVSIVVLRALRWMALYVLDVIACSRHM